jgi:GNAT superfamily N-acetyltransferase
MAELVIRHVAGKDFDQWLKLWNGYNAFYGRVGKAELRSDVTEATWSRLLDPAEPMHGLVALSDRRIIGLAHYLFHRSTISIAPTCYLPDLFTLPAFRGRGVASALIRRVFEEARNGGSERLYWQTHESNTPARHLYDRFAEQSGFIVYRVFL